MLVGNNNSYHYSFICAHMIDWLVEVQRHLLHHMGNLMTASFIGGGNRSTWRKVQSCGNKLPNFITYDMKIMHTSRSLELV
jgi:hypothetical protein